MRVLNSPFVDWLSFTIHGDDLVQVSEFWRGLLGATTDFRPGGLYGYTETAYLPGGGRIMVRESRPDMGVHVILPSKALGRLSLSARELLQIISDFEGKVTRIDLAVDTDLTTLDDVWQAIRRNEAVTTARVGLESRGFRPSDGALDGGRTIYIGHASSDRRVRIYDKAAEQSVSGVWSRIEVQLRRSQAQNAVSLLLAGEAYQSIFISALDFRDRDESDSNRSRWRRSRWYVSWLGGSGRRLRLSAPEDKSSLPEVQAWFEHALGPTLAALVMAHGGDLEFVTGIVSRSVSRIPPGRLAEARYYQQRGGLWS